MNPISSTERVRSVSSCTLARVAGALYFFNLLAAGLLEWAFPGKMNLAAGLIELVGMTAVTLVIYQLFNAVQRNLSLLAAAFNLAGITLEAIQFGLGGTEIGMVFHGLFCMVIAFLIFRSGFLPRILAALLAFGGLAWLTYLTPRLADHLSPWNLACGLIGEALVFLWLLIMGVNEKEWKQQGSPANAPILS